MLLGEVIDDRPHVLDVQRLGRVLLRDRGEDLGDRGVGGQPFRPLPREQPRHELGPVGRHLEQRLVDQMQRQVAAPDVEDERHPRPQRDHVGEVLLRPDAEIDAAGLARFASGRE